MATMTRTEKHKLILQAVGPVEDSRYKGVSGKTIRALINAGALSDELNIPVCHGVGTHDLLRFLEAHPRFTAHGLVGHRNLGGEQYGFTVEGVESHAKLTREEIYAFVNLFHSADELHLDDEGAYAWFD